MSRLLFKKFVISGNTSSKIDQARLRIFTLGILFVLGFVIVSIRLMDLTLIGAAQSEEETSSIQARNHHEIRSNILDRNGAILATSLKTSSLFADPRMIDDPVTIANELVGILPHLKYGDVLQKLQRNGQFIWLQRNLTPKQAYRVNSLGHPGLQFKEETRRVYPKGALTAHIVGFTDVDNNGLSGIEKSFDGLLNNGKSDLSLTIDIRLQHIVKREISRIISEFEAKGGSGLVLDIETGEVLSMVSLPDFNPHFPANITDSAKFNQTTLGVYEMGSTFKIFSTAGALDLGAVQVNDSFDTRKALKIGRHRINDFHAQRRIMTLPEVFVHSSNIGTALMAQELGGGKLRDFYRDLGLLNKASIELPEIGAPITPPNWGEIYAATASYGHGIAVSPLQVSQAVATILNDGYQVTPTLIRQNSPNHNQGKNKAKLSIISPQTSATMRELMELVIIKGTGSKAFVDGYRIGGKTGTAEKVMPRGYDKKALLSSFVSAFPINDPKYLILVIIDEPVGQKQSWGYATAGWTAAPAVGRIIKQMTRLFDLPPNHANTKAIQNSLSPYIRDKKDKHLASF